MREYNNDNIQLKYFNEVSFAFNPIPIIIENTSLDNIFVEVYIGGNKIGILKREKSKEGQIYFDLSSIIQSAIYPEHSIMYNIDIQGSKLCRVASVRLLSNDSFINTFYTDVIWGALQIGEIFKQSKTRTWFKNYPFTVGAYTSQSVSVLTRYDNEKYSDYERDTEMGTITIFNPSEMFPDAVNKAAIKIRNSDNINVFDYTFDDTFRADPNNVILKLNISEKKGGIYLRWIDIHGDYCYYLFCTTSENLEVKNEGSEISPFFDSIEIDNNYHPGNLSIQTKTVQKKITLYERFVDKETFDFLSGVISSPVVDMYIGNDTFIGVNISDGTVNKKDSHLQDFSCTLEYPQNYNQVL